MNSIATSVRPQGLLSAIAEFVQESLRSRGNSMVGTSAEPGNELNLLQLYRLTRGRETIDPAVGSLLAKRFKA